MAAFSNSGMISYKEVSMGWQASWLDRVLSLRGIFAFWFGVSAAYQLNIIGSLSLQEASFAVLAPILWIRAGKESSRKLHYIVWVLMAWLAIQLGTDIFRSIPVEDIARGCARIFFFLCGLLSLHFCLMKDYKLITLMLLGSGLNYIIAYYYFPSQYSYSDPWKWNFASAFTFIALAVLCFLGKYKYDRFIWVSVLLGLAAISAFQNFRSHAGLLSLVSCRLLFERQFLRISKISRILLTTLAALAVLALYAYMASAGVLGDTAQNKVEEQFNRDEGILSIVIQGRSEFRASSKAIMDSPFVGYGSWAKHPEYIQYLWSGKSSEFVSGEYASLIEIGTIPTHSYLFGAWVDGGVIPGILWACVWLVAANVVLSIQTEEGVLPKLALFFSVFLLWDILFSPFGLGARAIAALSIVMIIFTRRYWSRGNWDRGTYKNHIPTRRVRI